MNPSRDAILLTHDFAEAAAHRGAVVLLLDLDDPDLGERRLLPATEQDLVRAAAYGKAARKIFLARRALLRHLLAASLGCAATDVIIGADSSGAPTLIAPKRSEPLFLSVSGRSSFAAFAVAPTPIGVDLEILGRPEDVPSAMLHESERARLAGLGAAARHRAFLELWTLKEAYLKALRRGLTREPSEIAVTMADGAISLFDREMPVAAKASLCKALPVKNDTLIVACVLL